MGYVVRYGNSKYDKTSSFSKNKFKIVFCTLILLFSISICCLFPRKVEGVRQRVLPFFNQDVRSAFSEMIISVEKGSEPKDAAAAFSRQILEGEGN